MKAFIFDLDGVIVDTANYHFIAWKRIGEKLGYHLTHEQNESLKGVSRVESLERILSWAGVDIDTPEKEALLIEKNEDYLNQIDRMGEKKYCLVFLNYLNMQNKMTFLLPWAPPVKMRHEF